MRILHVTQATESGGLVNVVLNILRDQVDRGWDVHLACPGDGELLGAATAITGVIVHPWPSVRSPFRNLIRESRDMHRIVRSIDPQIIHLHSSKAGLVVRLAVRGRIPTVLQPHAWSFEAVTGPTKWAALHWERFAIRWTTGTLCVSDGEARVGVVGRTLARRSTVVYNGIDLHMWAPRSRYQARERLDIDHEARVVVLVGRLVPQKGQDVALTAWPLVRSRVPGALLYLVGEGPDETALRHMDQTGVHLVGAANPLDWYAASDLVLVPSRWEGMPLVILEAMACGRPIVTTDVAGAAESVGPHSAVIPIDDPESLATAVVATLHDTTGSEAQARALRDRAEELFDVSASCAGTAAFDALCAGAAPVSSPAVNSSTVPNAS